MAVVTAGSFSRTVTEVGTYDGGHWSSIGLMNVGTTGLKSLTVSGTDLGTSSYSWAVRTGETGCEGTGWVLDSSVTCLVGAGSGGTLRVVVTGGAIVRSLSQSLSFGTGHLSNTWMSNRISTGSALVSMLGHGFGLADYSSASSFGGTGCESTEWLSST
eukprot:1326084-Rhodomonas_salina.1